MNFRQVGDQRVRHSVREVFLFGVMREAFERKNCDGLKVSRGRSIRNVFAPSPGGNPKDDYRENGKPQSRQWPESPPPSSRNQWFRNGLHRRLERLFFLFQMFVPEPPGVNFGFIGEDAGLFLMRVPMNGQAFLFPTPSGALAALQIGGNFFPRV
jgi:hypothetical protein